MRGASLARLEISEEPVQDVQVDVAEKRQRQAACGRSTEDPAQGIVGAHGLG